MLLVVQIYSNDSCWCKERPPGVHLIQNGNLDEIFASNDFDFTSLSLFTLVKRSEHQTPTLAKKTGTLNLLHGTIAPDPGHRTGTGCPASNRDRNSLFHMRLYWNQKFRPLFVTGHSVPVL
jgi:hypothetical protein